MTQLLRTHHRHVCCNPATNTKAHHVHGCKRLLLQKPVIEHGLMGNSLDPVRTGGLPIARMRGGIHRRPLCQSVMKLEPALKTLHPMEHEHRCPCTSLQYVE